MSSRATEGTGALAPVAPEPVAPASAERHRSPWSVLSFKNIGAVYVWLLIILVFSIRESDTFPTSETVQTILNQNAISGLIALALVIPLSAGVFDLSVGSAMGLCNMFVAYLLVDKDLPMLAAIVATLGIGLLIGLVNAAVVVVFKIDSFIATLATGSLMVATTTIISDRPIIGAQLSGDFGDIATTTVQGVGVPVFVMLALAVVVWYVLGYTVAGRRAYATGFNQVGARLAGIRTARLRFITLIVSGVVAAASGVLLASQVSSGSPGIGPPYLLDAFAAAFLGATQFGGRFNAWGTVIAVLLLGTGKTGLILSGAPQWAPSMFAGIVLLVALALTNVGRGQRA